MKGKAKMNYQTELNLITSGKYIEGMDLLCKNFSKETYEIEVINLLSQFFYKPNLEQFEATFKKNEKLLRNYPYLLNKRLVEISKSPFLLLPITEKIFYFYDKTNCTFTKIEVNSRKETKYFFENVENPIYVEEEFNEFNLNFLVDNVRASEDLAKENHIYLQYQNSEKFSLLLYYIDLEPLLKQKKIVFLIGEESNLYPIDFKERFNIDYEAMEFQEVRPEEVKRIAPQFISGTQGGHRFLREIVDGHPNLLSLRAFNILMIDLFYDKAGNEFSHTDFVENLENWSPYPPRYNQYQIPPDYMNHLLRNVKKYKPKSCCEKLACCHLSYANWINQPLKSRVVPMIYSYFHGAYGQLKNSFDLVQKIVSSFPYVYTHQLVRDPIISLQGRAEHFHKQTVSGKTLIFRKNFIKSQYVYVRKPNLNINFFKNIYIIRFEDLKLNPKATILSLCSTFNLPLDEILFSTTLDGVAVLTTNGLCANGFSIKTLYRERPQFFNEDDCAILEQIMFPDYESFEYYPNHSVNESQKEEILVRLSQIPFQYETYYLNEFPEECFTEHSKESFGLELKKIRKDLIECLDQNDNKCNSWFKLLKPMKELMVNPLYENQDSLPHLEDSDVDFLNAPLLYPKEDN